MRQPAGPRVPLLAGNGAGVWVVLLIGWGLAAVTWLAWLAARIAAALAGGHVPSFSERWVFTVPLAHQPRRGPARPPSWSSRPGSPGVRGRQRQWPWRGGSSAAASRARRTRSPRSPATRRSRR